MKSKRNVEGNVALHVSLYRDTEATVAVGEYADHTDNKSRFYNFTASSKRSPHDKRNRRLGDTIALARLFAEVAKQLTEDAAALELKLFGSPSSEKPVLADVDYTLKLNGYFDGFDVTYVDFYGNVTKLGPSDATALEVDPAELSTEGVEDAF